MNTLGLLLAAGRGRRMGGNKQFHLVSTPGGEKPLVAAAFDTIATLCDSMFVVVGHRAEEVSAILTPRHFEVVIADPEAPMFSSIKAGLRAVLDSCRTATHKTPPPRYSGEGFSILLQLGDHPSLNPTTLQHLLSIAREHPTQAVMPTFDGNGGHPVMIPSAIAEKILAADGAGGLRQFWLDNPELCLRIEVEDPGVIQNVNTP